MLLECEEKQYPFIIVSYCEKRIYWKKKAIKEVLNILSWDLQFSLSRNVSTSNSSFPSICIFNFEKLRSSSSLCRFAKFKCRKFALKFDQTWKRRGKRYFLNLSLKISAVTIFNVFKIHFFFFLFFFFASPFLNF